MPFLDTNISGFISKSRRHLTIAKQKQKHFDDNIITLVKGQNVLQLLLKTYQINLLGFLCL